MVNVNIFDFKMSLREKGHRVHATDNIQETKDNLKVLSLFDKYYMEKKFDSLQDVFHELNSNLCQNLHVKNCHENSMFDSSIHSFVL